VGDKSPKAKQRDQKQKAAAKVKDKAKNVAGDSQVLPKKK
jgi:hypothetical protein